MKSGLFRYDKISFLIVLSGLPVIALVFFLTSSIVAAVVTILSFLVIAGFVESFTWRRMTRDIDNVKRQYKEKLIPKSITNEEEKERIFQQDIKDIVLDLYDNTKLTEEEMTRYLLKQDIRVIITDLHANNKLSKK